MSVKALTVTWLASFGCALFTSIFGGWTQAFSSLLVLMVLDFIAGMVVAGIFHKSKKTNSGALSSAAGVKGIAKKVLTIMLVAVAHQIDLLLATNVLKDTVCIALCINEIVSLLENVGLMGVKYPAILQKALDVLKAKVNDDSVSSELRGESNQTK